METSLYQEQEPDKTQELKKNMFLDFGAGSNTKQQKFASLLASPDMNMLKMASPELEKMLLASNNLLQTPTPTQFLYPKYVTDEQEAYARGFVEALAQLQNSGMPGQPQITGAPAAGVPGTSGLQDGGNKPGEAASSNSDQPPTYSTLLPMSSAPTIPSISATSAATTLANMSAVNPTIGLPQKRPYQFVPSALAAHAPPPTSTIPGAMSAGTLPAALSVPSSSSSSAPSTSAGLRVNVKDEPSHSADHTVPSGSSQVSPAPSSSRLTDSPGPGSPGSVNMDNDADLSLNMGDQEGMKLERKRARNRIAARKCRTRKLERISRLEEKVADLKNRNNDLLQHATSLNEQVVQLKQQIMDHMKTGCQIMMPNAQSLSQS